VLLRVPYGPRTDPIEAFDFSEVADPSEHEAFLWGNPAFACAGLLLRSFQERGWDMEPGDHLELDDLPAYTWTEDGEPHLLPCAETLLPERAVDSILAAGLIPLSSHRQRPAVRVVRYQSLADPPAPLAGPWSPA
jgi:type VI secretion system protein ImpC